MSMVDKEKRSIQNLVPYSVAPRDNDPSTIYLDANENPYPREYRLTNKYFNRYPEPQPRALLESYAAFAGVKPENLLVSLGGDEAIKLIIEAFCNQGEDAILFSPPTFGMYAIDSQVVGAQVLEAPLTEDFQLDVPAVIEASKNAKVIFICSPNNPTGNLMKVEDIEAVLTSANPNAIVVLDEAYIEFSDRESFATRLAEFPNLAIIRTLSKAFGVAGIRCGFTIANAELITTLQKVIAPYPIPLPVLEIAEQAIDKDGIEYMKTAVKQINQNKAIFIEELAQLSFVQKIYPSDANFVLIEMQDAGKVHEYLKAQHIYVKKQSGKFANMLRISIGTESEIKRVIQVLKEYI